MKPGVESQSLITWPEGNGRLVNHLFDKAKARVQLDRAAVELIPTADGGVDVILSIEKDATRAVFERGR